MSATDSRSPYGSDTMASVDDGKLVIADLSDEEAWLSMGEESAVPLPDYR
jgi:hypothetical protein